MTDPDYLNRICPQGPVGQQLPRWPGERSMDSQDRPVTQAEQYGLMYGAGRPIVAFDIDGVLSDSRWRLPLIRGMGIAGHIAIEDRDEHIPHTVDNKLWYEYSVEDRDRRWTDFYDLMGKDKPFVFGAELLRQFREVYHIEFWTGRPEWWRRNTVSWLMEYDLLPLEEKYAYEKHSSLDEAVRRSASWLFMREDTDHRSASVVKLELAISRGENGGLPFLVLDDDASVISALESIGVCGAVPLWHGEEIRGLSRG